MNNFQNRTSEFISLAQKHNLQHVRRPGKNTRKNKLQNRRKFTIIAANIAKDIQRTTEKLQKLAELAKSKNLFDDPSAKISELTSEIKEDVQLLNKELLVLQQEATIENQQQSANKQASLHSEKIIKALKNKLGTATQTFKEILKIRTENLQEQHIRKQRFIGAGNTGTLAPKYNESSPMYSHFQSPPENNNSLRNRQIATKNPSSLVHPNNSVSIAMPHQFMQQEEIYTSQRSGAVESIERTLHELTGIFRQLSHLVSDQGESIQRIDEQVEDSLVNVERSHNVLLKSLSQISRNRWLIFKIFLIVLFFIVIFMIFFI